MIGLPVSAKHTGVSLFDKICDIKRSTSNFRCYGINLSYVFKSYVQWLLLKDDEDEDDGKKIVKRRTNARSSDAAVEQLDNDETLLQP